MPPVRLLELRNTYKWGGGPDKTILLSASRHDPRRVSVVVAYVRGGHDREFVITDKAHALGLTFYEVEEQGKFDLRVLRAIRDIVVKHDINLIHAHDYKSDLFAYIIKYLLRSRSLKILSTAHGWTLSNVRGKLYHRLDIFLMRRFSHVLSVSCATKNELVASGVSPSLISVLHNAIDTEAWLPSQRHLNHQDNSPSVQYSPVIGYVGRITPEKDLHTWLRVAAQVAQKFPHARFVLVGDGKDELLLKDLQNLADTFGIAKQVVFQGYQENPMAFYAAFDIFLLTSTTEGLSNSLLEAMAMGLPTVVTKVGGNEELVADGYTGYALPPGDVNGLAQAITALAQDKQLCHKMGQAGRERIEHEFSFARRLQDIETLYERLIGI